MAKKVVVIIGATASGKSALALELCKRHGGEIISADSMQVYRRMDIGTAKPSPDEMAEIPHHLINIRDFVQPFSAADFITEAKAALNDITSRGRLPFVVGGTGMYTEMLFNSGEAPDAAPNELVRSELRAKCEAEGNDALWQYLRTVDPIAAESVHPNNVKRVIRYLEIYLTTGLTPTEFNIRSTSGEREFEPTIYCLRRELDETYRRIDLRVDEMIKKGLVDEAEALWRDGLASTPTASQAIGYKELFPCFEGREPLDRCVELIKQHSRNYAKRQNTYFKRIGGVIYKAPEEHFDI